MYKRTVGRRDPRLLVRSFVLYPTRPLKETCIGISQSAVSVIGL
jgi:hypothetical protein